MKTTLQQHVLEYLRQSSGFIPGGTIEDSMRELTGAKGGTTSRQLRLMENKGIIVKQMRSIEGGRPFVTYRLDEVSVNQQSLFGKEEETGSAKQITR